MAPPPTNEERIEEARRVAKSDPSQAETLYKQVIEKPPGSNEAGLRDYENALNGLGELYRDGKKPDQLADLIKTSRSALSSFAKAKTAKLGKLVFNQTIALLTSISSTTPRLLQQHSELPRNPDHDHEILYRMGSFRKTVVSSSEP